MRHITLIAGVASLFVASPSAAATFLITPDGTGAAVNIQTAVTACVDGDIIELADGVFAGPSNHDIDFEGKAITIRSRSGDPELVVIEVGGTSEDPRRGFLFHSGEGRKSVLEGVTITGGWAPDHGHGGGGREGGGALVCGASPTIVNCIFRHNRAADSGAGLATCDSATPRVSSSVFHGNISMRSGGGVAVGHIAHPEFIDCVFSGNYAQLEGGALSVTTGSSVILTGCEFYANEATLGAVVRQVSNTTVRYTDCTFVRNIGRSGSFHVVGSSTAIVEGSTLYGNIGTSGPSAFLVASDGHLDLRSTIVAFGEGRAILLGVGGENTATISCTDIYGNTGGDWTIDIAKQQGVRGNLSEDPLFCGIDDGDFSLAYNSPCLSSTCKRIGAYGNGCGVWDTTDDEIGPLSRMLDVKGNPGRGSVELRFATEATPPVISIHDVAGRMVRVFTPQGASGSLTWDGTNATGRTVAAGTYFVRVVAGERNETSRILWIR